MSSTPSVHELVAHAHVRKWHEMPLRCVAAIFVRNPRDFYRSGEGCGRRTHDPLLTFAASARRNAAIV